ncbi:ribonuclease H-like domain-containing protein, partial [Mycena rebaudengoi]
GKKVLKQKVNDALIELIVCCGIAPRNIGRAEFKNFVSALNANYNLISRTTFEDSLVPAYAANVRIAVIKSCWFLTISGDGGKLKRKKFVSVNITTIHRQSFCVDLDDVSRISQTGEYFAELFKKWLVTIGPSRFTAATSDSAGNMNKGRLLTVKEFPRLFNFADACHNLHNTIKDICNIEAFQPIIAEIKGLLAFMSLSTYSHDWFDTAREELKISRGLQSVGETRFGTICWSLDSILRGIPVFISIVRNPKLGIESEVRDRGPHFADDDDVFKFKRDLTRLGAVLMPLARAIQCLESKDTTLADVYLYWLAVVAQLNDLICRDNKPAPSKKSKYEETLKDLIRQIANYRFSQLIEDERASNVYFTAFVLDLDNRGATILATPNPLQIRPVTVSFSGGQPAVMQHPPLIQRIGLSLQKILQKEYGNEYRPDRTVEEAKSAMRDINPYIVHRVPKDALSALRVQLQGFLDGVQPSDRKKKPTESPRQWWVRLLTQDDSDILAALAAKIFSANPVSMPDERGMSTVTWINSDVRNKQDVSTLSNHLAIRGFSRMGAERANAILSALKGTDICFTEGTQ